jgi:hypothetical protein
MKATSAQMIIKKQEQIGARKGHGTRFCAKAAFDLLRNK